MYGISFHIQVIIEISNFSFVRGNTHILDSVSLSVYEGEYLSIIGPNGAGKTTLLKCLIRINSGGEGTITLKERPLISYRQKELAKLVSYVPQSDGRSLPFTVEEFVMMGRYPYLSPFTSINKDDKQAVRNSLEFRRLKRQKAELELEKVELEKKMRAVKAPGMVEREARRKLGLIRPNEIEYRFKPPEKDD